MAIKPQWGVPRSAFAARRRRSPFVSGGAEVTFLATDVVGSTERLAEVGDREWRRILDRHDQLVRRHLDEYGGRELGSAGDSFVAAFSRPMSAAACAVAVRSSLAGISLKVRAGIHTGRCEVHRERFAGMALHIASRVAAVAGPDEIFVSGHTRDLLGGASLMFENRGVRALKGVPGEWKIHSLLHMDAGSCHAARRVQRDWIQKQGGGKKRLIAWLSAALVISISLVTIRAFSRSTMEATEIAATYSPRGTIALTLRSGSRFELQLQSQTRSPPDAVGTYDVLRSLLWSDDGCLLAFAAGDHPGVVHVMTVDQTGRLSKLTRTPGDFRVLDWSADRTLLLVSSGEVVGGGLHAINVESRAIAETTIGRFDPEDRSPTAALPCD